MKKNKPKYDKPSIKVIILKQQARLLVGSDSGGGDGEGFDWD